jgi:hypothetical protein
MLDLMYVAITVVFFALMLALVYGCDRIVGADEEALGSTPSLDTSDGDVEVTAR